MELKLAEVFQDGMVMQRQKPIRLFGTAERGVTVTVFWNNERIAHREIPAGHFCIELPAQEAATDGTLTLETAGGERITLNHVDIGEVFLAGGQSNMEFPLRYDRGCEALCRNADAHFRFFNVGRYAFPGERTEHLKPEEPYWNRWMRFESGDAPYFSAVAAFFGKELREALPEVPVGIIGCNWGGTSASSWLDPNELSGELKIYRDEYEEAIRGLDLAKYKKAQARIRRQTYSTHGNAAQEKTMRIEATKPVNARQRALMQIFEKMQKVGPESEKRPGGLYETMLCTIVPVTLRGILFYQGESDDSHAEFYDVLLTRLIACWRRDFMDEALPFFFVQLAPFESWMSTTGEPYPLLREKQQIVEDTVGRAHVPYQHHGQRQPL